MSYERREWPRTEVRSDTKLVLYDAVLSGNSLNISMGGLYLLLNDTVGVSDHQQIRLALETEAGVVALTGRVCGIRPHTSDLGSRSLMGLAIKFAPLDSITKQVMTSLLDAVRRAGMSLKVTGVLTSPSMNDLLLVPDSLTWRPAARIRRPVRSDATRVREHRI